MKDLTEKEEEIMQFFWENGPMYVKKIVELYPDPKPHINTISTFVRLLEQKGFVKHEQKGNSYLYYAAINREEYSHRTLRSVMKRYFNNSMMGVVSALFKDDNVSDEELKELINLVKNKNSQK